MNPEEEFKDTVFLVIDYIRKSGKEGEDLLDAFRTMAELDNDKFVRYIVNSIDRKRSNRKSKVIPFERRSANEN